ncbi:hypothetical protein K488DRAFT_75083 [Vararia minispora EC-137]|uniref:Uncharacterized protein n=1 Tax=Vararia minispora EC-137 TaxID=1314806 RepID=A0ACB8Q4U1_9AGAM|nr:hypothetical protein K488DRAFT_75083 [Vararia minispora EC-137]
MPVAREQCARESVVRAWEVLGDGSRRQEAMFDAVYGPLVFATFGVTETVQLAVNAWKEIPSAPAPISLDRKHNELDADRENGKGKKRPRTKNGDGIAYKRGVALFAISWFSWDHCTSYLAAYHNVTFPTLTIFALVPKSSPSAPSDSNWTWEPMACLPRHRPHRALLP